MSTNNNNATAKPKVNRRSSLKNRNVDKSNPLDLLKIKSKRNSISWGQTNTFKFNSIDTWIKII